MSDLCKLRKACEICVSDRGKEDEELVQRLYDYVYNNYVVHGSIWDCKLLNETLDRFEEEREFRNLDGVYFRVKRNDKWQSICFSDLTENEMREVLKSKCEDWLLDLCIRLGKVIRNIGDAFDIAIGEDED